MSNDDDAFVVTDNTQLVLISGESGTGKSTSLMEIPGQDRWLYANCEAGKRLPFRNKYVQEIITDPYQVLELMDQCIQQPDAINGMIIDTATFLMDMYESLYIINSSNGQKAWGMYQQFWKELMQQKVAKMTKPVIILAHTRQELNENSGDYQTVVPVKGALKGTGIEAYFSTVVSTKKMKLKDLKDYENDMLHITDDDELVGFKHVFQTRITKGTTGERIRSPIGMFSVKETYIDNNAQMLLNHMNEYYNG